MFSHLNQISGSRNFSNKSSQLRDTWLFVDSTLRNTHTHSPLGFYKLVHPLVDSYHGYGQKFNVIEDGMSIFPKYDV